MNYDENSDVGYRRNRPSEVGGRRVFPERCWVGRSFAAQSQWPGCGTAGHGAAPHFGCAGRHDENMGHALAVHERSHAPAPT